MRRDGVIDGVVIGSAKISGSDATQSMIGMYDSLDRDDISYTLVSGLVISMYNIVDIAQIARHTRSPAIGVTYADSAGLEGSIRRHFESPDAKIAEYAALPARKRIRLRTGHDVFVVYDGCTHNDTKTVLDSLTHNGAVPEPLRVAQLIAHAVDSAQV